MKWTELLVGPAVLVVTFATPALAAEIVVTMEPSSSEVVTNVATSAPDPPAPTDTPAPTAPAVAIDVPEAEPAGRLGGRQLYRPIVERAAAQYGVPVDLVEAVIEVESAFNPAARSRKGAAGLMQLMPDTARSLGVVDIWDPAANIDGGTRYLAQMMQQFGGDQRLALAGYNAGPNAVIAAGGIPRYAETIGYVRKVEGILGGFGGHYRLGAARPTPFRTVRRSDGKMHITNLGHTQSSLRLLRDKRGSLTLTNR